MLIHETPIEKALRELSEREKTCEILVSESAQAEHDYKIKFAQEILKAEGTEAVKKAHATINSATEFLNYLKKDAEYKFAREKLNDIRTAVSARQSILSAQTIADKMHAQLS